MSTKSKRGAPKGHIGNPTGKNQWEGIRSEKPIAVRLLKDLDSQLRLYAENTGRSLTEVVEEAIAEKLEALKTEERAAS